ncbi:MAG: arginine--tRNA ligase, partial [Candidatus Levybacteria bacterium RIFCSPLOWO2_12_FULL_37_14]
MTDVKAEIISILRQSLAEFTKEEINFLVEEPENENFGDYFSNAALAFWANKESRIKNQKWKSPLELAQKIVNSIIHDSKFMIHFDRVEAVKPGFINFYLSQEYLIAQLSLVSGKTLLRYVHETERSFAGRRIMVEFTDPNPFKEFHIGHLYSNTVGESVSRLLEAMGANVKRANYQGDVGMHIAKSLYAIFQISNLKSQISNLEKKSAKERAEFLGQCYATGAKDYEDSEKAKREIEQLNKKIYDKDPDLMPLYEKGRQWSLEYFETIYKRLGTKFDFYYFESIVGINGLKLVQEYLQKGPPASLDAKHLRAGVFEKSQGAVIFPGKKFGLHDRVFINSLGLPTYEAKDLGLAFKKYSDFKFDQSISVTGNEITEYFKVILAALKQIDPELAAKIKHLPHGMVRIPTGKMSSRSGNIVTGEWLLDEAKKLLKSKFSEMMEEVLEQVAVGAIKYALLKSSLGHDIEFNFE